MQDHLGSPIRLLGDDDSDALAYDEFGVPLVTAQHINQPFGFTGYQVDDVSGVYYAQARYYDAGMGRFGAEDPICSGLNWYTYCLNNPILMIDPFGLDSYILYEPYDDNLEKMELMRQELYGLYGTDTHFIPISSGSQFAEIWNGEGTGDYRGLGFDAKGNAVSVDATVLLFHGNAQGIGFKTSNDSWTKDNLTQAEIGNLNQISMDTLISFSCEGAVAGGSVANSFYERQKNNVSQIIGADGNVSVNVNKTTTTRGALWWKNTVTTSSLDIYTSSNNPDAKGFKLYSNNSNAGVDYLGGLGYHFNSLTDIITMARGYK